MKPVIVAFASAAVLAACTTVAHEHHDTDQADTLRPPPGSNLMMRAPITISDDLEVIVSDVVIPAGATVPRHFHPGEEFVYVIEGSALHVEAGKPDQILKAGDAYVIPPQAEHAPRGGPDGARAIVFRVHKHGLPERVNIGENGPVADEQSFDFDRSSDEITTLMDNIDSRGDFHCHPMARRAVKCFADSARELYVFTEPGDPAHPSALFRGFVAGANGVPILKEAGWSAVDEETAKVFFRSVYGWPKTSAQKH
jgi:quercetin dioxygenase-like cupin family protein